jgi:hypothetical protein
MLDPARAEGIDARIGLRLGGESFVGHLHDGVFDIARGPIDGADLVLSGAPPAIGAIVYGGQRIAAMEAAGALTVQGDRALLDRFVTLFPLPPKAVPVS